MRPISDLRSAVMLLTRIPVRGRPTAEAAAAAWAWPLVGALVAGLACAAGALAAGLGAAPGVAAVAVLGTQVALTGALHEDGLADAADGVWGGATPLRRLEIMRDSRIGTYGVVALVLSLLLRWTLLAAIVADGAWLAVGVAAVVSRAAMAAVMGALPPARADGLSRGAGRPPRLTVALALALAAAALATAGGAGLVAALFAALAATGVARLARRRIGGQTGDVLGATQQVTEIAVLVALGSR